MDRENLNILTVGVVTKPFAFEGKRQRIANEGIEALGQHVEDVAPEEMERRAKEMFTQMAKKTATSQRA
jgi:cell division GTPase FtsZ